MDPRNPNASLNWAEAGGLLTPTTEKMIHNLLSSTGPLHFDDPRHLLYPHHQPNGHKKKGKYTRNFPHPPRQQVNGSRPINGDVAQKLRQRLEKKGDSGTNKEEKEAATQKEEARKPTRNLQIEKEPMPAPPAPQPRISIAKRGSLNFGEMTPISSFRMLFGEELPLAENHVTPVPSKRKASLRKPLPLKVQTIQTTVPETKQEVSEMSPTEQFMNFDD